MPILKLPYSLPMQKVPSCNFNYTSLLHHASKILRYRADSSYIRVIDEDVFDVARGAIAAGLEEIVGVVEDLAAVVDADSSVVLVVVVGAGIADDTGIEVVALVVSVRTRKKINVTLPVFITPPKSAK